MQRVGVLNDGAEWIFAERDAHACAFTWGCC